MNDERPIEKLLRCAAQERSAAAGPPPELHPVNRRLLQEEVAREFPPPAPKQSALAAWWAVVQRRWAYGIAVVAMLAVAAIAVIPLLSKSKSQIHLAQSAPGEARRELELAERAPAIAESLAAPIIPTESDSALTGSRLGKAETAAAPVVPAPTTRFYSEASDRRADNSATTILSDVALASDAIQPASASKAKPTRADEVAESQNRPAPPLVAQRAQPTRSTRGNLTASDDAARQSEFSKLGVADGKKTIATVAGTDIDSDGTITVAKSANPLTGAAASGYAFVAGNGDSNEERQRSSLNSQVYANVEAKQSRKKEALAFKDKMPVLVNFKVEQKGRDLRVVDGDGSIYRGVVDEENTLYKQVVARQNLNLSNAHENKFKFPTPKAGEASSATKSQAGEYYLYRVEGTNRSLNQNVVFTWNFVDTNALVAGDLNYNAAAQKLDATKLPSQFPALLQKSFINGRVQFGAGQEVEVNAAPVKP